MPSFSTPESPTLAGWPNLQAIEIDVQDPRIACVFELRQLHGLDVQDGHDASSIHFLVLANVQAVGCARLTPASAAGQFPHQTDNRVKLFSANMVDSSLSHPELCLELGALYFTQKADSPTGIYSKDDANSDHGILSVIGRRLATRQILMQLCQAMFSKSLSIGVRYWIAVLPPLLVHALNQVGFFFKQIGPAFKNIGDASEVAPYKVDLHHVQKTMGTSRPDLLRWIRGDGSDPRDKRGSMTNDEI
jgi:N-acyl amino acid synthase of PEP-CTERM/exosortase system